MNEKSLAYAKYWRTCLADAELLGKGRFRRADLKNMELRPADELQHGRISLELAQQLFKQVAQNIETLEITIRPYIYYANVDHGKSIQNATPEVITPIVSQAVLDRQGRIYPKNNTIIPRDILEPLDDGAFAIGHINALDGWLSSLNTPIFEMRMNGKCDPALHHAHWLKYLDYCKKMLHKVAKHWIQEIAPFHMDDQWIITKKNNNATGASTHILALYDNIQAQNPASLLFEQYASEDIAPPEPCLLPNSGFSLRLGHSSDTYPLADAQRDALTHQLIAKHGEILAVNGPPGTGKTTLLLSVIASYWVRAALEGGNPPVIAAASTNNQAVTNIIDAFSKDFSRGQGAFSGRWLPDIKSFGAYFASSANEEKLGKKYQTRSFFNRVEDLTYYETAKNAYMKAAKIALPDLVSPSVKNIALELQALIKGAEQQLVSIEAAWVALQRAKDALHKELGELPDVALSARRSALLAKENDLNRCKTLKTKWQSYLGDESWVYTLLSWLPPVHKKRLLRAKSFLNDLCPDSFEDTHWYSVEQISDEIQFDIDQLSSDLGVLRAVLDCGERVMQAHSNALMLWGEATYYLGVKPPLPPELRTLASCDKAADTEIRFKAFLYATHYWEARWLLEIEGMRNTLTTEKNKTGAEPIKKRWYRRMMLTPCVVSTFFMLPKEFLVSRYESGDYVPDYLYNYIDLLIVDEAGQVLPEVAGAAFSLAKQAFIIGDTLQIEPIWSMTSQIDIGNLIQTGIMDTTSIKANYNRITELGKSAASGSVMKIAQYATRYHYDKELARGMYLYEHRRCYDEIVAYCNALCYKNKLIAKRGSNKNPTEGLPAIGYLHIDGKCELRGTSRVNQLEATMIAKWIHHHRAALEAKYGKKIHEIIGVVTPFGGQVAAITEACVRFGIPVGKGSGEMTVGTVHSLQGAERLIIIFSPTYSRDADGSFVDSSPSMLNVSVSRAKDNFLVFGDMSIFNPAETSKPRGLLASFLFAHESNTLEFID